MPNQRADAILRELLAGAEPAEAARRYREAWGEQADRAWADVQRTLGRILAAEPRPRMRRGDTLRLEALRECWLHVSNRCNLACTHCMFASSPHDPLELSTGRLVEIAGEARALGCRLFYLTGGEPLVHPGFATLAGAILANPDAHMVVLTNTLMVPRMEGVLSALPRERVHFQVSLDCPREHHDEIRGEGCDAGKHESHHENHKEHEGFGQLRFRTSCSSCPSW